jgi:hypothetical protein
MPDTATHPDRRATPKWPDLTQKERVVRHLRQHEELDRIEAERVYHIGRLAARIRDLKDEGYVFDAPQDDDGIAHYSLVREPGDNENTEGTQGGAVSVETAADLWRALPAGSLARDYVALLAKCAKGEVVLGALEDTIEPEALSDWEAASLLERDITIDRVTRCREKLCRKGPVVVADGHRKGKEIYKLNESLTSQLNRSNDE